MRQKIFLILALLCAVAQGTWAQIPDPTVFDDVWDGRSTSKPEFYSGWFEVNPAYKYYDVVIIKKASELAYVRDNFKSYEKKDILLMANLDMGAVSWIPMGNDNGSITSYWGTFYGNGHTIRIVIKDATANYQGLFAEIGVNGKVRDLHVAGKIACKASRLVGGIAGESWSDVIRNCWVSADVSSEWKESASSFTAKVGGIVGANESTFKPSYITYCIMTGNVKNDDADVGGIAGFNAGRLEDAKCVIDHVTFYGSVSSEHKQNNKYVGDQDGKLNDEHDSFTDSQLAEHLNSFTGYDMYRYAVKYPYSVTVKTVGPGTIRTWAADEYDVRGTRSGKTFSADINGTRLAPRTSHLAPRTSAKTTAADGSPVDTTEIDDSVYEAIWANEYDTMPAYFGEFVMDYGFLKVYEGGLEYDGKYYVANLLMADDADNYALISLADEYIVDATLTGRTFYKDGTWQTICLPFSLSALEGSPLEGATVKELATGEGAATGFDAATGTLTLDFVDADRIVAGKPYIVKWQSGDGIQDPVFRGVTISAQDPIEQRTMSGDERVHFIGIYCPVQLEANNYANLYLGADSQLRCPAAEGFYLNAFRAGFLVDLGDGATPTSIVINFGDGEVTGITDPTPAWEGSGNAWFTLDGRKLGSKKPAKKGVYIYKGAKIVIK